MGGVALLVVEHAPADRRGLYGVRSRRSACRSNCIGQRRAGRGQPSPVTPSSWLGVGIPFLLSVALVVGVVVRVRIAESPVFEQLRQAKARSRRPPVPLFQRHWRLVIITALLFAANKAVSYLTIGGDVRSYAVTTLHLNRTAVLVVVMVSAFAVHRDVSGAVRYSGAAISYAIARSPVARSHRPSSRCSSPAPRPPTA